MVVAGLALLGWLVWPVASSSSARCFDAGYFLQPPLGWLLGGWLLWVLVNSGLVRYRCSCVAVGRCPGASGRRVRRSPPPNWSRSARQLEAATGWRGHLHAGLPGLHRRACSARICGSRGLAAEQMEFRLSQWRLRSPTFPPVNPHFAGGYINYYYFGLYLVAHLIKLTGIYAEVAFNLTIAMLFALTVVNVFAVAYSAVANYLPLPRRAESGARRATIGTWAWVRRCWRRSLSRFLAISTASLVRTLATLDPGLCLGHSRPQADGRCRGRLSTGRHDGATLPYDFWGPSRVLEPTINEFPYWSFFADLHLHIIRHPALGHVLALTLVLLENARTNWRRRWRWGLGAAGNHVLSWVRWPASTCGVADLPSVSACWLFW